MVNDVYEFWKLQKKIPAEILDKIEPFTFIPQEYYEAFPNLEDPSVTAIELIDGKIRFRTYPLEPHGNIIDEMIG